MKIYGLKNLQNIAEYRGKAMVITTLILSLALPITMAIMLWDPLLTLRNNQLWILVFLMLFFIISVYIFFNSSTALHSAWQWLEKLSEEEAPDDLVEQAFNNASYLAIELNKRLSSEENFERWKNDQLKILSEFNSKNDIKDEKRSIILQELNNEISLIEKEFNNLVRIITSLNKSARAIVSDSLKTGEVSTFSEGVTISTPGTPLNTINDKLWEISKLIEKYKDKRNELKTYFN